MRKEDFIVGKWYHSPSWSNKDFKAIKFLNLTQYGFIQYSERIVLSDLSKYSIEIRTLSSKAINHTDYREVPILEIAQYLPKDHPDLQNIETYELCIKSYNGQNITTSIPGRIYKRINNKLFYNNISQGICSYNDTTRQEWYIPATKEEYDAQFELKEFPERGWCKNNSRKLHNFLKNKYPDCKINIRSGIIGFAWNKNSYYDISVESGNPEYTIEQLNKFINNNSQQNEQESNTLSTITSENRQPIRRGTVAIRHGGQQSTTGTRPKGNITISNTGQTRIRTAQISKSVVIRENY